MKITFVVLVIQGLRTICANVTTEAAATFSTRAAGSGSMWTSWLTTHSTHCQANCRRVLFIVRICIDKGLSVPPSRCVGADKKNTTEMCEGGDCSSHLRTNDTIRKKQNDIENENRGHLTLIIILSLTSGVTILVILCAVWLVVPKKEDEKRLVRPHQKGKRLLTVSRLGQLGSVFSSSGLALHKLMRRSSSGIVQTKPEHSKKIEEPRLKGIENPAFETDAGDPEHISTIPSISSVTEINLKDANSSIQ